MSRNRFPKYPGGGGGRGGIPPERSSVPGALGGEKIGNLSSLASLRTQTYFQVKQEPEKTGCSRRLSQISPLAHGPQTLAYSQVRISREFSFILETISKISAIIPTQTIRAANLRI